MQQDYTNYDFFKLYNLTEYSPSQNSYNGFLPIKIETISAIDERPVNPRYSFKLPLAIGQITDAVSVSYSNKNTKLINRILGQAVSTMFGSLGGSPTDTGNTASRIGEEASKYFLASYDPGSLNKRLDLEFILPLVGTTYNVRMANNSGEEFVKRLYNYLGALQGIIYPSNYGFSTPPMVRVTIGGMYKNFKAFIEGVTLRSSEELINVGGSMIPLIYYGSIKFINVFMYGWDFGLLEDFNLSNDPSILFGVSRGQIATNKELYASIDGYNNQSRNTLKDTATIVKDAKLDVGTNTAEQLVDGKIKDNLRTNLQQYLSQNNGFSVDNTQLSKWTNNTASILKDGSFLHNIQSITSMYNAVRNGNVLDVVKTVGDFIGNGTLYGVGLDGFSPIYNAYKLVERALDVGTIDAYMYTAGVILNSGVLDDITVLGNVTRATNTGFNSLCDQIRQIFVSGANLIGNSSKTLNMEAVSENYSNSYNINTELSSTSDKTMAIYNGVMANTLIAQNALSLSQSMSDVINGCIGSNNTPALTDPLGLLTVGNTYAVANNLASGMSNYKSSFESIFEASQELYANNQLNASEYIQIKNICDAANRLDLTYLNEINPIVNERVENIANALSEAGI